LGRYVGKVGGERSPAPTMVAMPESEAPLVRRCHLARHQEGLARWQGLSGERSGGAGAECPPEGVTVGEAREGPGKPLSVSFESH